MALAILQKIQHILHDSPQILYNIHGYGSDSLQNIFSKNAIPIKQIFFF